MPQAARVADNTAHGTPLGSGPGSKDVNIGYSKAWRALPAGVGAGIETASNAMKALADKPQVRPPDMISTLVDVNTGLADAAAAAAQHGNAGAVGATSSALAGLATANVALTTAYTSAAAAPGGEPAATQAYTEGIKAAASAAAGAAVAAIAAITDMHTCPCCSGPIAHGPGVVTQGSGSVVINGLPASRQADKVFEAGGGADPITKGCANVNIGG